MPARPTPTPDALVEAAIESLLQLGVADLLSAAGARAIAARAGVSAATLFHHFGSIQTLADAVLGRVYDPRRPPPEVEIGTGIGEIAGSTLPVGTALGFHAGEFDRLSGDPEHPLRVGLWALGGATGRAAYGTYLRERDAGLHAQVRRLYDGWGREVRPPMDVPRFVAAHAALLSGAVIRGSVDAASVDRDTFARSAASLSLVMLRTQGERRDLDDRLAEINYYPLPDRGTRHRLAGRRQPQRDRVVAAARGLFWEQGHDTTTVADVARAAGTSTSTVHALFDGKDDLAVSALLEEAREHVHPGELDWRTRLLDVATLLARSAHLTTPYVAEVVTAERSRDDEVIRDQVELALRDAVATGDLRGDLPVRELAHTALVVLLARLLSHRAEGAAGALAWLHLVLLDGQAGRELPGMESNHRR